MAGVSMGAHLLKRKVLKHSEFMLVDQQEDYGGVWKQNKYPGIACDVPSHGYVMRYFLKPDWSMKYAPGSEIQGYYADIAKYYGLEKNTKFKTKVIEARWNEDTYLWEVLLEDLATGKRTTWTANSVVHSGGQFSRPKWANIPGRESFKGTQWHTAEWRDDYDLTGKRVAIIGTGPSTGQVAPRIAPIVKQLNIYQRSATYVVPRGDGPIPKWKQKLFSWFRPLLWLYHVWWYASFESSKPMWLSGTKRHAKAQAFALQNLESQVKDPITREKLRPRNEFGCKRILVLDDWYPIFNRPNVELITDKPIRITEHGIISKPPDQLPGEELAGQPVGSYDLRNEDPNAKEQEREIDVLLWGTGFEMADQGGHFQVYGVGGINLAEEWGDSPKCYYSVAVTKFPNFMLTLGPNAANFWSNITTLVEIQCNYNCKLIKQIKQKNQKNAYALYVDPQVQKDYNAWIKRLMGGIAILSPNCSNYYTNSKGEATYWSPFHGYYYAWLMRWPRMKDFVQLQKPRSAINGVAKKTSTATATAV
ncbi:FAD/NAD(P)-binding domain-containing protein [Lepidopterella palustris CBS 459.81]|uniref:FAD/NAD(P)-binding domain-containing protein n=1 Tax=Lepidopterella palustris CBS 459.81 TaxID=1314670 RepID=A0A8E2E0S6_9PEZI|nr:FAD/NAD(P)-binding domain-containing protein [Lepidopterella palustris CBS 459.81]